MDVLFDCKTCFSVALLEDLLFNCLVQLQKWALLIFKLNNFKLGLVTNALACVEDDKKINVQETKIYRYRYIRVLYRYRV